MPGIEVRDRFPIHVSWKICTRENGVPVRRIEIPWSCVSWIWEDIGFALRQSFIYCYITTLNVLFWEGRGEHAEALNTLCVCKDYLPRFGTSTLPRTAQWVMSVSADIIRFG